jgi:hypothetical protein
VKEEFKYLKNQDYSIYFAKHIKWSEVEDIPIININSKLIQLLFSKKTKNLEFLIVDNPTYQENTFKELYAILKQKELNKLLVIRSMYNLSFNDCLHKPKYKNNTNKYKNSSYFIDQNTIHSLKYFENLLRTLKIFYDIKKVIITDFSFIKELQISTSKIIDTLIDFCKIFNLKIIVIIDQKAYNTF